MNSGLVLCLASTAFAQFDFQFDQEQRRWTLRNGVVEAVYELTPEGRFEFNRFAVPRTSELWSSAAGFSRSPIRIQVDGRQYGPDTEFALIAQFVRPISREGYRQYIILQDSAGLGRIQLELEMFKDQPVIRQSIRFRNLQNAGVQVTEADMLPLSLADRGRTYRAFSVNQWGGGGLYGNFEPSTETLGSDAEFVVYSGAAASQCSWAAMRDSINRGLFVGWEFDGRAIASLRHDESARRLEFSVLITDLNRRLAPNEEFRVPAAFLGTFRGDWEEAGYRTQRFVEAALARAAPDDRFPYVVWNSWGYQTEIDEAVLRRNAQIAASLGVELFVVDLGWARHIGDWYPDPKKFPSGMRALSDYVRSLGMKFGLHVAVLEASASSPALLAHPDWTASYNENYFGAASLCPAHQPVREWLVRELLRVVDEYGVDWILQDGENMVKRCSKETHTHAPDDSNYSNAVDGIDYVVGEVLRERPNVHWENCQDGGSMMTFSMVRRYVTSIAADNTDPLTTRQAIYGATYPFPPRYVDRYMGDEALSQYVTRSYMFGGPWIFMNRLPLLKDEDLQLAASEIGVYKTLRAKIRDGQVFRLTGRPAQGAIDAIQSFDSGSGSAVIFAYRTAAPENSHVLRPRGLNPRRGYLVRFQDNPQIFMTDGGQLMTEGIRVWLLAQYGAEIVYIDPLPQ